MLRSGSSHFVGIVLIIAASTAVPAYATSILYTDRAAWEAASTGLVTISFEGLASSGIPGNFSTAQGLTLSSVQFFGLTPPSSYYLLVVDPAQSTEHNWQSGDILEGPKAEWASATGYIQANLPAGVTAVGSDIMTRTPDQGALLVSISTGESFLLATFSRPNRAFVGITSDEPITYIRFQPSSGYALMDNFSLGSASAPEAETPEADTMILGATGLLGLLLARRLRRWV